MAGFVEDAESEAGFNPIVTCVSYGAPGKSVRRHTRWPRPQLRWRVLSGRTLAARAGAIWGAPAQIQFPGAPFNRPRPDGFSPVFSYRWLASPAATLWLNSVRPVAGSGLAIATEKNRRQDRRR